jgi:hypothetical protein
LHKAVAKNDNAVIEWLQQLIEKHLSIVFLAKLSSNQRQGFKWNHKCIYRVYTETQYLQKILQKASCMGKANFIQIRAHKSGRKY